MLTVVHLPSAPGLLFRQNLPVIGNGDEAKSDPIREQTRLIAVDETDTSESVSHD